MPVTPADENDLRVIAAQLGREPRGVVGVAWRCPCGRPGVVATEPRLPDGSPFPTTFYLSCQRAVTEVSRLEASGLMTQLTQRLADDAELAERDRQAHAAYIAARDKLGRVPELADVSAGGMPDRVKCLHALVGHALAAGRGVNPVGDEALDLIGDFWTRPCGAEGAAGDPGQGQ